MHEMVKIQAGQDLVIAFLLVILQLPIGKYPINSLPLGVDVPRNENLKEALAIAGLTPLLCAHYKALKFFRLLEHFRVHSDILLSFRAEDVATAAVLSVVRATTILCHYTHSNLFRL